MIVVKSVKNDILYNVFYSKIVRIKDIENGMEYILILM